jgi:hypothetical protein
VSLLVLNANVCISICFWHRTVQQLLLCNPNDERQILPFVVRRNLPTAERR